MKILNKKIIVISTIVAILQSIILINKYNETISQRKKYSSCAAVCVKTDSNNSTVSLSSQTDLKNTNLSAIIFLDLISKTFTLTNAGNISSFDDKQFSKFVKVFTNGNITNFHEPINYKNIKLKYNEAQIDYFTFPWLDIGPGKLSDISSDSLKVLIYKDSNRHFIKYVVTKRNQNEIIIIDERLINHD